MRYRKLDQDLDMVFGESQASLHRDTPDAVAQAVRTRMALLTGEWFLDTTEGTPYSTSILGTNTLALRDDAVRERILGTQGVRSIDSYNSYYNPDTREFSVSVTISTVYGSTSFTEII